MVNLMMLVEFGHDVDMFTVSAENFRWQKQKIKIRKSNRRLNRQIYDFSSDGNEGDQNDKTTLYRQNVLNRLCTKPSDMEIKEALEKKLNFCRAPAKR